MARKILLADDSVTAQNMGRKILADAGYEVITVNNGSAALKKVAEVRPDLIVLDVYMPGYSGLEVCQRLKETGDTARIPVLLTVGKLEPFKPEEARRVRAEAFIVKPFEASELLAALTKLEDKIVPRSESSKPGRFARAIAAVEEGRYEKTEASDGDSSWKNRLSFPSKKGKKAEAQDTADSEIYNPVNKDLRTVLEPKPAPAQPAKAQETKQEIKEESRVDLGALAPEGLPKDVTPEEIAALAAAAAQIQGKLAEAKSGDSFAENAIAAAPAAPVQSGEVKPAEASPVDVKPVEFKAGDVDTGETKTFEVKAVEPAFEREAESFKAEPQAAPAAVAEAAAAAAAATAKDQALAAAVGSSSVISTSDAAATFVGQSSASSSLEVSAAIDAVQSAGFAAPPSSERNFEAAQDRSQADPEPVTMAMAAAAAAQGNASSSSRWTAVSVALAPEESSVALEDEMRKAQAAEAAPAAVESVPAEASSSLAEKESTDSKSAETKLAAEPVSDISSAMESSQRSEPMPSASVPAEPEAAQSVSAVANIEAGPVRAVVKNFEAVSAPAVEAPPVVSAEPGTGLTESSELQAAAWKSDAASVTQETQREEIVSAPVALSEPSAVDGAGSYHRESPEELKEEPKHQEVAQRAEVTPEIESSPAVAATAASVDEVPAFGKQEAEISQPAAVADSEIVTKTSPSTEPSAEKPAAHREHDIAATTAAAWASWRRVRESGDPNDSAQSGYPGNDRSAKDRTTDDRSAADEAAMAAAAGAENAGADNTSTSEESPELASIVDSVLADLRPKIVEEISKKLKKK